MGDQEKRLVLFDFDGVIADSFAASYALVQRFCAHITHDHFRAGFEGNIHDAFTMWESQEHGPECDHGLDWDAAYGVISANINAVFPGIDTTLSGLSARHMLIVVSSAPDEFIEGFLQRVGMRGYFQEIMGNRVHKSKTEKIKMIFAAYDTSPEDCVFITDTLGDMREAKKVAVSAIGVSWGVHDHETLQKGAPYRIVDSPLEILPTVNEYFSSSKK